MRSAGKVSIVIPTHGKRTLEATIKSIRDSTYKNVEIVVVDENQERSFQRNVGVRKSTGDYILFLDSDMTVHPKLLEECVSLMKWFDGLYIPEVIVRHPIKTFFRQFYNGTCVDAVRFVKAEYVIPFDTDITGFEDWDFDRRFQGSKCSSYFPIYHHAKSHLTRKLFYYTKWLKVYKKKYPKCKELSLRYRLWTVWTEKGKWKKLLLSPLSIPKEWEEQRLLPKTSPKH
jgi:glycosyltransferase involved in cell wall biosynthesis